MSRKQKAVMEYLAINQTITLRQAVYLTGRNIYANAPAHVGAMLSRMVKAGLIVRTKPGMFVAAPKTNPAPAEMLRDCPLFQP